MIFGFAVSPNDVLLPSNAIELEEDAPRGFAPVNPVSESIPFGSLVNKSATAFQLRFCKSQS